MAVAVQSHLPAPTLASALGERRPIGVRALLVGERIATQRFERQDPLARLPLAVAVPEGGVAVLLRYGAIVLMNVAREAEAAVLERLKPLVSDPLTPVEIDELKIELRSDGDDAVDMTGTVCLRELTIERLQLVADALAKSLVLSHYETGIALAFDRIEPMAAALRREGRIGIAGRPLLRQIGNALLVQQKMVGRVETGEKPELLWDHPELERLYAKLAEEYELRDRTRALDYKQAVVLRTTETMLGLVQERSSRRLEWYVLLLIFAELAVAIYSLAK
jgi:required for meiotic nuclear division protein 1